LLYLTVVSETLLPAAAIR